MQKLTNLLSGQLGETLALAKFISVGLHAYVSPPGAPGHDIMVHTPDGLKTVEVKTRQYIDRPSEISRWPVNMNTKADADFILFVALSLRTFEPTFYLLNNAQAKDAYRENKHGGNCLPSKVRASVNANDFSAITGEPAELPPTNAVEEPKTKAQKPALRHTIAQEVEFAGRRIVQYTCQSIDVFENGKLQKNAIENLRDLAKKLDVSEFNGSGGVHNTRQLGKAVIDAIKLTDSVDRVGAG